MRIPLSWLREFTQLPADATAEDLMADLVKVGLEEEDVHRPTDELSGPIVVGKVLEKTPEEHSNGKTINWCKVQVVPDGQTQTLEGEGIDPSGVQGVVCGAHNFDVGDKVIVTLPGAVLPGDFRISARKTYGHMSAGMIASEKELGLGEGHEGIVVLGEWGLDPEIGADVYELLNLRDEAAEINVTADRAYVLSMRGVAREYGHATGTQTVDPASSLQAPEANDTGYPARIADETPLRGVPGATRFVTRIIDNVDPTIPTPAWMSSRLRLAGVRSISLPVDITNYVMLELGQPMHAYDADKLRGEITVRRATEGETIVTLDGKERKLHGEDLLIADESGPIGIAGVMGGLDTEVTDQTTRVVLEAANFDPVTIGRSRRRHRLPSEASKRNERGVDWNIAPIAAQRAAELFVELAGGTIVEGVTDVGTAPEPQVIRLAADYPSRRIGREFSEDDVQRVLEDLGGTVEKETDTNGETVLVFTAPSWRFDLEIPEDLTEEVARLIGYDTIPSTLPTPPAGRGLTRTQLMRRQVADSLSASGLVEVLTYPFVREADNRLYGSATEEAGASQQMVHLANPISAEFGWLRTSILPGLLDTLRRNVSRGFRDVALYETGAVFLPGDRLGSAQIPPLGEKPSESVLNDLLTGIPDQPQHLAAVFAGADSAPGPQHTPEAYDWQDAIATALDIAEILGVELTVAQGKHQAFHPGRTAELKLDDVVIGYAGELHPKLVDNADLPERCVAMELDLDALMAQTPEVVDAQPITTYPATNQDVALVVDNSVVAADVMQVLENGAGDLLEDIALFDIYDGQGIEDGKKSLAFTMRFRAADRTLTAEEASEARQAAIDQAAQKFGAVQR